MSHTNFAPQLTPNHVIRWLRAVGVEKRPASGELAKASFLPAAGRRRQAPFHLSSTSRCRIADSWRHLARAVDEAASRDGGSKGVSAPRVPGQGRGGGGGALLACFHRWMPFWGERVVNTLWFGPSKPGDHAALRCVAGRFERRSGKKYIEGSLAEVHSLGEVH